MKLEKNMKIGLGITTLVVLLLAVSLVGGNQRAYAGESSDSPVVLRIIGLLASILDKITPEVEMDEAMLGGVTNYDILDTTGGYRVDGTAVIDGSGNLTGTISADSLVTLDAGQLKSYTNSTSTVVTTQTLVEADILNYDTMLIIPNTGSLTLTLPATSTMTSMVPSAGDRQEICLYNATSTVDVTITLAAGTGMDIERIATSTTNGSAGLLVLQEQNSACLTFVRETNTDVSVLMHSYIDAD